MTYFLKSGNTFNVSAKAALDIYEELPAGTYTVKFDVMKDIFYLVKIEDFDLRGKLYGNTEKMTKRILHAFADRPNATGVMLSGEKGSGKSLQAKHISKVAMAEGIPTIVINEPWHGENFNSFIQSIEQPVVILFDEFEKVYDKEDQEKMLTLLDGVYPTKKLFVITCNDKYRVNEHMRNRPGRIFYRLDYTGLDKAFITEYCEDNLKNLDHIEALCRLAAAFGSFNFDMLKAMVEEMNRFDEAPHEVIEVLNAKPEAEEDRVYDIRLVVGNMEVPEEAFHSTKWHGNPLSPSNKIQVHFNKKAFAGAGGSDWDDDEDSNWETKYFSSSDLRSIDANTGVIQFINPKGDMLSLTKTVERNLNWAAF